MILESSFVYKKFEANKSMLLKCLIYTFIWGFVAHGYMFSNNSVSHDSLGELIAMDWILETKQASGRVFWPVYRLLFVGRMAQPWLSGILSLLYFGFAAFLICKVFSIHSNFLLALTCGTLTVNISVIALTSTYIQDLDADALAMLCAVAAVFCWNMHRFGFLAGIPFITISLGLYQSFISVTITLAIFVCIKELYSGVSAKNVFVKGLRAISMLIAGGLFYLCVLKLYEMAGKFSMDSGSYNSLSAIQSITFERFIQLVVDCWIVTVKELLAHASVYPSVIDKGIHFFLFSFTAGGQF